MGQIHIRSLMRRLLIPRTVILGLLAAIVGVFSGLGIWLFKYLYNLLKEFGYGNLVGWLSQKMNWLVILLPVVGGVLVAIVLKYLGGKEKVGGTAGIIQAVEISGGRLRYQYLPGRTLAAILSIGTGASVGPEDPSVQIGADIGSFLGQKLRLTEEETSSLVAAGAAAAIAAAFNAPIAGVFFALEIVIGDLTGNGMASVLIASVLSSAVTQILSGTSPAFQVHSYTISSAWEYLLYLALGLLAGPISALYVHLLYWAQDFFQKMRIPRWLQTAIAGLVVGGVGFLLPQVLGVGYGTITSILASAKFSFWLLLAILFAKLVLTPVSIGGGFAGGVFAPSLFIGAALGGAFGVGAQYLFPSLGISPSAYALVGMAAVLAGAVHAPLTAAILLFEMTSDYRIILPLMLSVAVSLLISQRIQPRSVYSLGLARKGFMLSRGKQVDILDTIAVSEVMNTGVEPLQPESIIRDARSRLILNHERGLPVIDGDGSLAGILAPSDLEQCQNDENETIKGLFIKNPEFVFPNETLASALKKMGRLNIGQLPVVMPESPKTLLGMIYRADVIHAYTLASQRRFDQRYIAQRSRLDAVTPDRVEVVEFRIENDSPVIGKKLSEIQFPGDCLVASLRRRNSVIIPRGDTRFVNGDTVVVVVQGNEMRQVRTLFEPINK